MWTNFPFLLVCSFFRPAALGNPPRGGCSVDATPTEIRSSPGPSSCGMPWVWGIKKIVIMICETLWNHETTMIYHDISIPLPTNMFFSRYEAYEAFNVNLELRSPQVALNFALGFITRHITRVGVGRSSANGSWILSLAGVEVLVSRCFKFCSLAYLALFSNFSVWTLGLIGRNQVESLQHLKSLRNVPTQCSDMRFCVAPASKNNISLLPLSI